MPTFGTRSNPAHYVEVADPANPGQVKRPSAGVVLKARSYPDGVALPDITVGDFGYWDATFDPNAITVSGDDGVTWVGPLFSVESLAAAITAGLDVGTALQQSSEALAAAQAAIAAAQNGVAADWLALANKPDTFPPSAHSHTTGQLGATALGKALLDSVTQQEARAAIGAGTGNGTSNLTLGNTASTAAPGNHSHSASAVTFTPSGPITATDVQGAILQAAATGGTGGSGSGSGLDVIYASGAYPVQPASAPAGVKVRHFYGPVQYQGPTWPGVLDTYDYAPLT